MYRNGKCKNHTKRDIIKDEISQVPKCEFWWMRNSKNNMNQMTNKRD